MNFKELIPERALPVCKPSCESPDIKVGHYKPNNSYWLYCGNCGQIGQQAVSKKFFSVRERKNAKELKSVKNHRKVAGDTLPVCKTPPHDPDIKLGVNMNGDQYRLFCEVCDARAENAIPHDELSDIEKGNAVELEPRKNESTIKAVQI